MSRANLFSGIKPVMPCMDDNGNIDLAAQAKHVASEYEEFQKAFCLYQTMSTGKQRAHLAEEAVDLMTCVATFLAAACPDLIVDAVQLVNCKNRMRGYFDHSND